ncbi:MAG: nitroreductase family deazaflavin-dependent oxidoreductase [Microthrixaceae bacterium]|nr:nitroreductase family deazaflavin-dependent oxidoreductase [Microthrixaceae bacterium]
MIFDRQYEPSPWEPIAEQVELYESTDGVEGGDFMGGACVILTSIGARSGNLRKTPLIRVTDGTNYVVIGSVGGAPNNPKWVYNLRAEPRVQLRDGAQVNEYVAREVTDAEEKATWWELATSVWSDYDVYQSSTDRIIPLFVLEPGDV